MARYSPLWIVAMSLAVSGAAMFAACGGEATTEGTGAGSTGAGAGSSGTGAGTGTGGGIDIAIDSLSIDPPSATLTVDQITPKTLMFTAIGKKKDGTMVNVPATFTVDNTAPGSIDGSGLYTTSNAAGGVVHVAASYGGKTATADLTVVFEPVVEEGNVPPGAEGAFDPMINTPMPGDPLSPDLAYPSDKTMFPPNVHRILFQWRAKGLSLFHLRFQGPYVDLSIYTDGVTPTCVAAGTDAGCWEATLQTWQWLAASSAGTSLTVSVEAADPAAPGVYYVGDQISISFSKKPVPGAIYYWSTTQAGVMRAAVSDAAPTSFMTPVQVGSCVACHTLSRSGKRLGADVGGEKLWVVDVNGTVPPPVVFDSYNNKDIPNAWSTFNPDTTRVISARSGILKLLDGSTGAPIGSPTGAIDLMGKFGTQPDWSPDGTRIAFAYGTNNKDRGIQGSSLAMMDHAADVFSNITIVRQSTGGSDTYAYPMFDPTGQWLVYMHATGASDKNAAAKLFVAPAQAGAMESDLVALNTIVADGVVLTGIANNMPTWAPLADATDVRWVAFASKRDYGLVLTNGSSYGDQLQQLWVAAIDPQKLGTASDPSFPAFRLPFQLLNENNHRPFWAEDAFNPGDGGVPDGGGSDASLPCANAGEDCSVAVCCAGTYCAPNTQGTGYVCDFLN